MFCKVYLQYDFVIQRVVTIYGLLSVQKSRMMNIKIKFAKHKKMSKYNVVYLDDSHRLN